MREIFTVGNRVHVSGHFATIRFVGELEGQSGTWYGIEWDEKQKGKHKGQYGGKTYFSLYDPESSGSFVREKHMKRGIGVMEAIESRYLPIGKVDDSPDVVNFFNMGGKEIQFYNRSKNGTCHMKQRDTAWNLYQTDLDLSTYSVASFAISPSHFSPMFPRVTHVNMSKTLIEDINVCFEILTGLPNVRSINISFNHFRIINVDENQPKAFPKVTKFNCDAVNFSFKHFVGLTDRFPNLEQATFAMNPISSLSVPPKGSLQKLESLALQQCLLQDWCQIQKLAHLPNLKMLNILDNKLKSVDFPVEATNSQFASLEMLILAGNKVENWLSFSKLAFLSKLSNLVLYENPLCELNVERFRDEVIGRLARLKILNKTEVLKEERKSASILYLKMYYNDWLKAGGFKNPEEIPKNAVSLVPENLDPLFLELHPKYHELFAVMGDGIVASGDTNAGKIKSALIKLNVVKRNRGERFADGVHVSQIKVLNSMTVAKIKLLVSRLLKVAPSHPMILFYRPHQHPDQEYALDSDLKTLSYYSVETTDSIVVEL